MHFLTGERDRFVAHDSSMNERCVEEEFLIILSCVFLQRHRSRHTWQMGTDSAPSQIVRRTSQEWNSQAKQLAGSR